MFKICRQTIGVQILHYFNYTIANINNIFDTKIGSLSDYYITSWILRNNVIFKIIYIYREANVMTPKLYICHARFNIHLLVLKIKLIIK